MQVLKNSKNHNSKSLTILLVLGLLVLISLSAPASAEKTLHGDWYYSGDTFTVEDDVYMVTHYNFYDTSVVLQVNDKSYVINEGGCKLTPTRKYCIDDIFQDLEDADEDDPLKFEGGEVYAGIKVIISSRGPDIDVSRSLSETKPELNQEVTVTVTIENEGSESADFYYKETLPGHAQLTSSSSGITRSLHSLSYETYISANDEKTFSYSFKVTDYQEVELSPQAWFIYENSRTNISVSTKKVSVDKPYELTASVSPSSVEATDQTGISVKATSTVSEDITVDDLRITIPSYLSIMSKPRELEKKNNEYYWNGTLAEDEYHLITFLLKPVRSGTYTIPVSIRVTDSEGKEFNEEKNLTLKSTIDKLEPILSVSDSSVSEGGKFRIAFSVKNTNFRVGFKNIQAWINSTAVPEIRAELDELLPGQTETLIINDTLTAPFLDKKENYEITAQGTYETNTNEEFEFSKTQKLTVTPVSEVITIKQEASKQIVRERSNLTITVNIKNNNEEAVKVDVGDEYSPAAVLIGGKSSASLSFDSSGTKQAYTYSLRIPGDYDSEWLVINTTAFIKDKNYKDSAILNITVNTTEPVQEQEEVVEQDQEQGETPTEQEQDKKGFFEKVIDSVTGFFKRILGMG